ncbi:MAG: prephenate dehydrogenase dimerization domain-containing protein, partial [Candidatus Neomarinimicrobiota bacterium]
MKIIIIGLGLIGGSIAKTLSSSNDYEILAFDSDQKSIKNALDNQSILGSLNSVTSKHVDRVKSLWGKLGSNIVVLDAEMHDQIFAYTSHLPHLAAYALLNTLKGLEQDDLSNFSGGGLGEFLRLVSSSPEMWADIFSMNKKNITLAIDDLMNSLSILKGKIGNDPQSLQD